MASSLITLRNILFAATAAVTQISMAAEPARVVFQSGASIPINAVALQGNNLVVVSATEGFTQGQTFPLASADHVYGEKPVEIYQGVALLLTDKPKEALKLLEPVIAMHKGTAKVPGNFWLEAARAALVAYATSNNAARCTEIGKEISEATPAQGIDPFVPLGKALILPSSRAEDRMLALKDLTVGSQPADVSAYASYFLGNLHQEEKRVQEALDAFLSVPGLYPTGGLILNAAAEIKGADILTTLGRRDEALALVNSAARVSTDTVLAEECKKRLETLK